MPVALITGASRGLGRALTHALAAREWTLVIDARGAGDLDTATADLHPGAVTEPIAGDVADPAHREELARATRRHGRLDLLVNNASELGPSPQPELAQYPLAELARVYQVNVLAPAGLAQLVLPELATASGTLVNISSDAAVEPYPGWGGYGPTKAALDHLTAILAVEQPDIRAYAFDPGDMRTTMQQHASPGEDISSLPEPETVVPALLRLVDERPPSGRYRAGELPAGSGAGVLS